MSSIVLLLAIAAFIVAAWRASAGRWTVRSAAASCSNEAEAEERPDWVRLEQLPPTSPRAFLEVVDPGFLEEGRLRTGSQGTTLSRELVRQVHLLPSGASPGGT
jgi:hypothetical protein